MKSLWAKQHVRVWLAIVGVATITLITVYTLVQQSNRLSANDLPMLTAQTVQKQLEKGTQPTEIVSGQKSDLRSSLSVFITITDNSEHILAASASLDGHTQLPPAGTFAYTKDHGSDHFTWQPKEGVRLATYMLTYGTAPNDGFIITGQSLSQVEDRIGTYGWLSLAGWLAIIAWASFTLLLPQYYSRR